MGDDNRDRVRCRPDSRARAGHSFTVSGRVVFDGATAPPSNLTALRLNMPDAGTNVTLAVAPATVSADGTFRIVGAPPGRYRLTANAPPSPPGWAPRSALVNGVDALDLPFEISPDRPIDNVVITFTDPDRTFGQPADDRRSADGRLLHHRVRDRSALLDTVASSQRHGAAGIDGTLCRTQSSARRVLRRSGNRRRAEPMVRSGVPRAAHASSNTNHARREREEGTGSPNQPLRRTDAILMIPGLRRPATCSIRFRAPWFC